MVFDGTLKFDTAIDKSGFESGISGIGELAKKGLAVTTASVTAAAGATVALGKSALDSYADYEQLVGGIDTLFGSSSDKLQEYAAQAYKTAGMSANEYMETVTSFSASLLSSLGGDTEKAAEYADMAITDMADNANKMGSSMESIENAYQGFAKQNYTMLDNLKLGYGGTKSEMERLLSDAEAISGIEYDVSSYSDIVDAIHVIQTEMGITGTTAEEASETISGSVASMKAAWDNLTVGIADDTQDFDGLVSDLVDSASAAAENILPRIETIIGGIGNFASSIGNIAAEAITGIAGYLPDIISAAVSLVDSLVEGFSENAPAIADAALDAGLQLLDGILSISAELFELGASLLTALLEGLSERMPDIAETAVSVISSLIESITASLPDILSALASIWSSVVSAVYSSLPELLDAVLSALPDIIEGIIGAIPEFVSAAADIITALVEALPEIIEMLIEALPEIITAIVEALIEAAPQILEAAGTMFMAIVEALPEILSALNEGLGELLSSIGEFLLNALVKVAEWALSLREKAIEAAADFIDSVVGFFSELPEKTGEFLTSAIESIIEWGAELRSNASEAASSFLENIKTFFSELPGNIMDFLKTALTNVVQWGVNLREKAREAASGMMTKIVDTIKELPGKMLEAGKNLVEGLWNGITGMGTWLKDKILDFGSSILDGFKSAFGISSPSKVMRDKVGKFIAQGIGTGFTEEMPAVTGQAVRAAERLIPEIESSAVSALHSQAAGAEVMTGTPSATSEIISNSYTYSTVNNSSGESGGGVTIHAQFVVGEEVVSEGVIDTASDILDQKQGLKVVMKKRGLAT